MKNSKTMEQRLHTYAISQDDSLDRHMPPTSKKSLFWIALASPLIALTAWLLLIWCCLNTDAN